MKKKVDTPYYIGEVERVAMKAPIYDLVIGNVHGARGQEDPDTSWEIPTGEEITEHEMSVESQDVGPAITSHEKTGGVVTRLQSKNKPLRPMKVAKTKIVNLTSTEFKKLQETDKSLDKLRKRIESDSVERPRQWGTEVYYIDQKNGLMYRQFISPPEKGSVVHKQLVLPHSLRESVLEVAHDSILGGHLATKNTYDRVTSNFFWPGAYDDVSRYCQSCDICQRTIPKGRCGKTPLVAMPIIGEPFARVAIDLVGPLPMSGRKHRWIELSETSLSYEGIRDLLIREQTLGVGSAELRVFIEERTPGSFKEMCNIAEQYLKAHGKSFRHWWMSDKHRSEGLETKGLNSENKNRFSNATSKYHGRSGQARVNGQSNPTAGRACWICSSVKHYARECPQNKPDRPMQSSKSKVGGNATVLACEEALLFKGGLKLTTKQDGDLRYFEDNGGKKYL